ncbi:MAG: hypothetical protein R3C03_16865 [Pirellulaceae bacterium]
MNSPRDDELSVFTELTYVKILAPSPSLTAVGADRVESFHVSRSLNGLIPVLLPARWFEKFHWPWFSRASIAASNWESPRFFR